MGATVKDKSSARKCQESAVKCVDAPALVGMCPLLAKDARKLVPSTSSGQALSELEEWGTCGLSRRCTCGKQAADRRSVVETTMRAAEVVMLQPGEQG